MTIQLFNTVSKTVEEFVSHVDGAVSMYSCGPTVYNHAHIGNLRAFLFADMLQRTLRVVGGYSVQWVMNITDIDDKTIRDSAIGSPAWKDEMGEQTSNPNDNISKLTEFYTNVFVRDIEQVGILANDMKAMPRATHYIESMQDLIRAIITNGFGYVSEGSVYFNLREWIKKEKYGKLFHVDFENFQEGVRIDADEYERESVSDFVLWKAHKDGEPFWDFDINGTNVSGRPGWHIECSAMGKDILGLPFDIHTGGVDLRFPHHEDEIAQSKAGYGVEPATFWCHNEFLEVEGKKMSKSLGNFFTLNDLIQKGIDPLDIRYFMVAAHYRSVFNFSFDGVVAASKARKRVQDFIYDVWQSNGDVELDVHAARTAIFTHLADDIHTPKALGELFAFINKINPSTLNQSSKDALLQLFTELNNVFAVWHIGEPPVVEVEPIPDEIASLAEQRWQAKQSRDFSAADEFRKQLLALGYEIKDSKTEYQIIRL